MTEVELKIDIHASISDCVHDLIRDMLNFLQLSPIDFKNGNVAQGVDEGEELSKRLIDSFVLRARAFGIVNERLQRN